MTIQGETRRLLTVICEAELESLVVEAAERLGAKGYTASDVRGGGSHGRRDASWRHNANVRIEFLCEFSVAEAIAEHLHDRYFADYAMVCFLSDVTVLRKMKF